MSAVRLITRIEKLRKNLEELAEVKGNNIDEEVICTSRHLDREINRYNKIRRLKGKNLLIKK